VSRSGMPRKRRVEFSGRSVSSRAAAGRRPALLWFRLRWLEDTAPYPRSPFYVLLSK
jgi:hypothetical protein